MHAAVQSQSQQRKQDGAAPAEATAVAESGPRGEPSSNLTFRIVRGSNVVRQAPVLRRQTDPSRAHDERIDPTRFQQIVELRQQFCSKTRGSVEIAGREAPSIVDADAIRFSSDRDISMIHASTPIRY